MTRILFLQHGLGYGGATKSLMVMQQALAGKVEIHTVVKRNKRLNKLLMPALSHSSKVLELDLPGVYSYSEGTIPMAAFGKNKDHVPTELISYILREKIDILHINSSVFSNLLRAIKEQTSCRVVVHLREMLPYGPQHPVDAYIIERTTQYADRILAISPEELRFFNAGERQLVLPNPHDFSVTDALLAHQPSIRNKVVVGMCANFIPVKGHLCFIKAIPLVQRANPGLHLEFRIIGYPARRSVRALIRQVARGTDYRLTVRRLIRRLHVRHLRLIPFTLNVLPELAELSVYVRPDLSGNPWGRDVIEAMALRKPVVAAGSSDFYVKNGQTGYLVAPNDHEALADAISKLVADPKLRRELGGNALQLAKEKSDVTNYGPILLNLYNAIIDDLR